MSSQRVLCSELVGPWSPHVQRPAAHHSRRSSPVRQLPVAGDPAYTSTMVLRRALIRAIAVPYGSRRTQNLPKTPGLRVACLVDQGAMPPPSWFLMSTRLSGRGCDVAVLVEAGGLVKAAREWLRL